MLTMFDKQIQLRMGQANVKRWVNDILPLLNEEDVLGVDGFATHTLPLEEGEGPQAYKTFQAKSDGLIKTILRLPDHTPVGAPDAALIASAPGAFMTRAVALVCTLTRPLETPAATSSRSR